MREFYFEKLIREKLQTLEVPFNSEDWKGMESLLDDVMEVEDQPQKDESNQEISEDILLATPLLSDFDKEIAQKLSSITESVPNDWELFASELDNDLFDQAVKGKIEEIPTDHKPADWALFESKLDGNPVDSVVRKTLLNYRVPFYAPDWLLLSEILNRPFDQAIREKISGLTLEMPASDWQRMSNTLAQTPDIISATPWYANWKNYVSYASVIIVLLLSISWGNHLTNLWEGQIEYVEYPHKLDGASLALDNQAEVHTKTPISSNHSPDNISPSAKINTQSVANNQKALPEEHTEENSFANASINQMALEATGNHMLAHIDEKVNETALDLDISVDPIESSIQETPLEFKLSGRGIHKIEPLWKRNNPELRIGLFGGNTSSMVELSDPGEMGYMGGLRLEVMVNQEFSIVTGLNYSLRNLTYEFQIFTPRRLDQTLQARLEMIELPILFRYNFPTQNRLNLYAQAGVITAVSIVEDYRAISNTSSPFGPSQTRPGGPIDERKYNTYVGNIYAAAGFEYQLNSSLAFQIEPYFQMNMQKTKGVGALGLGFEKQVYTAGIGLGLFYSLKKREKQ